MDFTMLPLSLQLPDEPFAFSLDELAEALSGIQDQRKPRGVRYPLYALLMIAVLAKLAGYSKLSAIAEWASLRQKLLAKVLGLARPIMPHATTWSRVFASGVDPRQLDQICANFFAQQSAPAKPKRGAMALNIDGKTLCGTIPAGAKQGVHLVAAYLPACGIVLAQLAVQAKANELTVAPSVLAQLDLAGKVVSGDAIFAQRNLSIQVVEGGGDYLWTVKGNQATLRDDIAWLFAPLKQGECGADFGWRQASAVSKGHGRVEEREIVVSSALSGYSDWPYLAQVFKLRVVRTESNGKKSEGVRYGVTSLPASIASPARLLELTREHWGIEGGLHQRRDVSLAEDRSQVRMGQAPHILASLNNVVVGLMIGQDQDNLASVQRNFAYRLDHALHQLDLAPVLRFS